MDFLVVIIMVNIALMKVDGKSLDPGRQVLNSPTHSPPQPVQQKYATKEIILYLTPSQIKALHEGKGLISPLQFPHNDVGKNIQAYVQRPPQVVTNHQNEHPHLAHPSSKRPTVQEPQSDNFVPVIPPLGYRQSEKPAYNNYQYLNPKRFLQPIQFFPNPNKNALIKETNNSPTPNSQENSQDKQISHQELKEKWLHLLNQNIAHFKALEVLTQNQREKANEKKNNFHYLTQIDSNNNYHKDASDVYNLVRANNAHQSEKHYALSQVEALALSNSQPILVHKEINIQHTPTQLIAHVPTPVLVPVSDSFKVKLPRTYAVPLDVIKTVPITLATNEADRLVPVEVEKHVPFPVTKNIYVDRPLFADRVVPQANPASKVGNLQEHNHEWHHSY